MSFLTQSFCTLTQRILSALLITVVAASCIIALPAYADDTPGSVSYVAADGTDLTKVVQCLPKQLSQPSLARALKESGNDFLERVFNFKGSYDGYELSDAEVSYRDCLKKKGIAIEAKV